MKFAGPLLLVEPVCGETQEEQLSEVSHEIHVVEIIFLRGFSGSCNSIALQSPVLLSRVGRGKRKEERRKGRRRSERGKGVKEERRKGGNEQREKEETNQ